MLSPLRGSTPADANAKAPHAPAQGDGVAPPQPDTEGSAEPTKPPAPIKFQVDTTSPHPRLIIPADKPVNAHPVSSSVIMRNVIGGTIFGASGGVYVAVTMLSSYPVATTAVIVGSAAGGALLGYLLTKK